MEPFVLITAFLLFGTYLFRHKSFYISKASTIIIFIGLLVWTAVTRPWSLNWQNGLSDIRDWLIPILVLLLFNVVARNKWHRWYIVLLSWLSLLAAFGIAQHFLNGVRPFVSLLSAYKTGFTINPDNQLAQVSYAVGLSSHPNGYGMLMLGGLLLTLGWIAEKKKVSLIRLFVLLVIGMALYWSYAKASIIVALILVSTFFILWLVRSPKLLGLLLTLMVIIVLTLSGYLLNHLPQALLSTFWWRVDLWKSAVHLLEQNASIWFLGNGMDLFAQVANYPQPHNVYIYILLQYGIPGFFLLLAMLIYILGQGWLLYRKGLFSTHPRLLGLWLGLIAYFIVGITESTLFGIENRTVFMILLAGFDGLCYEFINKNTLKQDSSIKSSNNAITADAL